MEEKKMETYCPASRKQWREWLQKNHIKKQSVWLILYKKESGKPTISWSDAVDEALCFGWIDSTRRPVDEEKFIQFFSKRKPKGTWSKINKDKVKRLIKEGLMAEAGLVSIKLAKKNGSWDFLNDVDDLKIPADLEKKFKTQPGTKKLFTELSKSVQKIHLFQLLSAKREETRAKRIDQIVNLMIEKKKQNDK